MLEILMIRAFSVPLVEGFSSHLFQVSTGTVPWRISSVLPSNGQQMCSDSRYKWDCGAVLVCHLFYGLTGDNCECWGVTLWKTAWHREERDFLCSRVKQVSHLWRQKLVCLLICSPLAPGTEEADVCTGTPLVPGLLYSLVQCPVFVL